MRDARIKALDATRQRSKALERWDSEGGASCDGPQKQERTSGRIDEMPLPPDVTLIQLHRRVIMLENAMLALLADSSDEHKPPVRARSAIVPLSAGSIPHPGTVQAD